jgi:hypothetical protein
MMAVRTNVLLLCLAEGTACAKDYVVTDYSLYPADLYLKDVENVDCWKVAQASRLLFSNPWSRCRVRFFEAPRKEGRCVAASLFLWM